MGKLFSLTITTLIICMLGCSEEKSITEPTRTVEEQEALTRVNSYLVLMAVEAFAADNNGWYPINAESDTTLAGKTLVDYLPGGVLLENPCTRERTEPREMTIAEGPTCEITGYGLNPGEIGYKAMSEAYGRYCTWFVIAGYGVDTVLVEISNVDDLEYTVILNSLAVQTAAEEFAARNDGLYPNYVLDTNLEGGTIIGYLPGRVSLLNPFTGAASEPSDGWADQKGQIGYVSIDKQALPMGYMINGVGHCEGRSIIVLQKDPPTID